jgi:hypothetical protein
VLPYRSVCCGLVIAICHKCFELILSEDQYLLTATSMFCLGKILGISDVAMFPCDDTDCGRLWSNLKAEMYTLHRMISFLMWKGYDQESNSGPQMYVIGMI